MAERSVADRIAPTSGLRGRRRCINAYRGVSATVAVTGMSIPSDWFARLIQLKVTNRNTAPVSRISANDSGRQVFVSSRAMAV